VTPNQQPNIHFSMERGMNELGTGFFVHKRFISAIIRVAFVTDRISYIITKAGVMSLL
jgi:hypothetical protein